MKKINAIIVLLFICIFAYSQNTIKGSFPELANQQVKLIGFEGFETFAIDSTKANGNGFFSLSYSTNDFGMGYLLAENNSSFIIILEDNGILLKGSDFSNVESIEILKGKENRLFEQYATEHPRRERSLSIWNYMERSHTESSYFFTHKIRKNAINSGKQKIRAVDSLFLANLPQNSYVSWYLPVRKLVSSVSVIAQYRTEEIPASIASFRNMDYTDPRLYKSGLLSDVIDSHFWLIENSGRTLDSVYIEMNISIDYMVENLIADEKKLNEITEYLFKLLESRSLFGASEYLALKLLNEQSCTINNDFAYQLENYRAMKIGNTASDFEFKGDVLTHGNNTIQKLSEINSEYIVVVFGASWCPACPSELSQIAGVYDKWKSQNVEVVFVSLDEEKEKFNSFVKDFPFISMCDYKKWESPAVKDYHVFATPTIYLLDNNFEIILKPNSVRQMDAWVEWYLVMGKE